MKYLASNLPYQWKQLENLDKTCKATTRGHWTSINIGQWSLRITLNDPHIHSFFTPEHIFQNAGQQNLLALGVTPDGGNRDQTPGLLRWPWFERARRLEMREPQRRSSPKNLWKYPLGPWSIVRPFMSRERLSEGLQRIVAEGAQSWTEISELQLWESTAGRFRGTEANPEPLQHTIPMHNKHAHQHAVKKD